jgi:hypothetical protein
MHVCLAWRSTGASCAALLVVLVEREERRDGRKRLEQNTRPAAKCFVGKKNQRREREES